MKKRKRMKGAVTLEASLLMPLVLYFFINLLSVFDILRMTSVIDAALHEAGNALCVTAFDVRFFEEHADAKEEGDTLLTAKALLSVPYASGKVAKTLEESGALSGCLKGGTDGISYLRSVAEAKKDIITLVADYTVCPLLKVLPFMDFPMSSIYYAHAWTGYDITGADEGSETEYVYVTPTGTVYHRSMECTHLKLSIRTTTMNALKRERNESGAIYHPCERCANGKETGTVYVTDYGNRYHTSLSCSGLKRTIYTIPIDEVNGLRPCSKCGR